MVKEEVKKGNYSTNKVQGFYILFDNFFEVHDEIPNSNPPSSDRKVDFSVIEWQLERIAVQSLKFGA